MEIRVLPSNIANIIAAGEVVQRPASVVKELMENAVDAGADKVQVVIQDAGRTLIQVVDNGCGMSKDQAVLSFKRHATSKIATAEDLQKIESYGFRGEALASIAAVAEVTLKTRRHEDETATMVKISDAEGDNAGNVQVSETAAPAGSNFAVRNLFYNTPARRKFLKTDAVEKKQIINEFLRVALTKKDISFSLEFDGKEMFRLAAVQTMKFRIRDIFGQECSDSLLPIHCETSVTNIDGFLFRPDKVKKTVFDQYFFVNGRYFRSAYLNKAVMKAYENLIPEGLNPSFFIFLEMDPSNFDVNVHPTKTELKFEDDSLIFNIVMAAAREALGRGGSDSLDFECADTPQLRNIGASFNEYFPPSEPAFSQGDFNPFENDGFPNQTAWDTSSKKDPFSPSSYTQGIKDQDLSRLFDAQSQVQKTVKPVLCKGKYLLCEGQTGIMIINARRAQCRILYERFLDALQHDVPVGQMSMFPLEVEVGAQNIPLLEENLPVLQRLGFDYSIFSANTIAVNAVPIGMTDDKMSLSALIYEVVNALGDEQISIASSIYGSLAEKLAKSASRSAAMPDSSEQARALIDELYGCENPEFTSDGQKIVYILQLDQLDKFFK